MFGVSYLRNSKALFRRLPRKMRDESAVVSIVRCGDVSWHRPTSRSVTDTVHHRHHHDHDDPHHDHDCHDHHSPLCRCTDKLGYPKTKYASQLDALNQVHRTKLETSRRLCAYRCAENVWHLSRQQPWQQRQQQKQQQYCSKNHHSRMLLQQQQRQRQSKTCRSPRTGDYLVEYSTRQSAQEGIVYVWHRYRQRMSLYRCTTCAAWHLAPKQPKKLYHEEGQSQTKYYCNWTYNSKQRQSP